MVQRGSSVKFLSYFQTWNASTRLASVLIIIATAGIAFTYASDDHWSHLEQDNPPTFHDLKHVK